MPKLYDMLTRHQVFLEGVKVFGAKQFDKRLREMQDDLQRRILAVPHDTMGEMSRTQLTMLVLQIARDAEKTMAAHEKETLQFLLALMTADLALSREIFELDKPGPLKDRPTTVLPKATLEEPKKLFRAIEQEPMPSDGSLLPALLKGVALGTVAGIAKQVRMGYANNLTPKATVAGIVGTQSNNYRDGLFSRLYRDNSAAIATGVQHVSSILQATLASFIYDEYEWVSVIDERTTDICYSRDGKIYTYGQGPLPPAHYNCRSKTVPRTQENAPSNQTYFGWLKTQPNTVLAEIMSARDASRFKAGELKKDDLPKFKDAKPLSISEFRGKLKTITAN